MTRWWCLVKVNECLKIEAVDMQIYSSRPEFHVKMCAFYSFAKLNRHFYSVFVVLFRPLLSCYAPSCLIDQFLRYSCSCLTE